MSNTRIITKADAEATRAEANRVWDVYIALRASVKDAAEAAARKEELTASYDAAVAARDKAREIESMVGQTILVPAAPAPAPAPVVAPPPPPAPAPAPVPAVAALTSDPVAAPASKKPAPPAPKAAPTKPAPADDDSFEDDLVEPK